MRGILTHHLVHMSVVAVLVAVGLYLVPEEHLSRWADAPLITYVAVGYVALLAIMARRTPWRAWTPLSAGLAGTFAAAALYFGLLVYVFFFGPFRHIGEVVYLVRGLFFSGVTYTIAGYAHLWWHERRDRKCRERAAMYEGVP